VYLNYFTRPWPARVINYSVHGTGVPFLELRKTYKGTLAGDDLKLSMDNGRGRGPQEIAFKRAK